MMQRTGPAAGGLFLMAALSAASAQTASPEKVLSGAAAYGDWHTIYMRLNRWSKKAVRSARTLSRMLGPIDSPQPSFPQRPEIPVQIMRQPFHQLEPAFPSTAVEPGGSNFFNLAAFKMSFDGEFKPETKTGRALNGSSIQKILAVGFDGGFQVAEVPAECLLLLIGDELFGEHQHAGLVDGVIDREGFSRRSGPDSARE